MYYPPSVQVAFAVVVLAANTVLIRLKLNKMLFCFIVAVLPLFSKYHVSTSCFTDNHLL